MPWKPALHLGFVGRAAASIAAICLLIVAVFAAVPIGCGAAQPARYRARTVGEWIEQLDSPDVQSRWYAAYALGQLGPQAAEAVEPLMRILENKREHEYVRGSAAWALGEIGLPAAERAVPLLIDTLSSRHVSVRRYAPWALGRMAPAAGPAVPKLRELLQDVDPQVRLRAAAALWLIAESPDALRVLDQMIQRGGPVAYTATELLGRMPAAPATTDLLLKALQSREAELRRTAAWALARQGDQTLEVLGPALRSDEPATRLAAVEALGMTGPAAVKQLVEMLHDGAGEVRASAARELGRLGPQARAARAALEQALNDPDAAVRQSAAWALRRIRSQTQ